MYYLTTGVWPLVSRRSFEAVSGPKVDYWLVQMVGALTAIVGASLLTGAEQRPSRSVRVLGAGAPVAFASIDLLFVARRRISPVYALDACLQVLFAAAWLRARHS